MTEQAQRTLSFGDLKRGVLDRGLCARCGLCAGVCPVEVIGFGERSFPRLQGDCIACGRCVRVCPGADVDYPALSQQCFRAAYDPRDLRGHQPRTFVGHPTDDTVRRAGASGGLTTGLLLYLLQTGRIRAAGVVGMHPERPYQPVPVLARTEEEIRAAAKSKYCLVPSMNVLAQMRREEGPFAVVALPCQVHGLRKLRNVDPALARKIPYIFGLYCHYSMEPDSHVEVLERLGIDPALIARFEFRGGGWPGGFYAILKDGSERALHTINIKNIMTIMLRLYGADRCYMCMDGLAEYADLAMGDFWAIDYPDRFGQMSWCTLVSERTERGREVLEAAMADGAVTLHELPPERFSRRTEYFAQGKKQETFVRLRRRKRRGLPIPDYHVKIPHPGLRATLVAAVYHSTRIFRGRRMRRWALGVLFSRAGQVLDHVNTFRKRIFLRFEGN